MLRRAPALAALVAAATLARPVLADGVKQHGVAAAATALGGHQQRELGPGAVGLGAIELPVTPALGAQLEVGALWLSAGEAPEDPRFEAQGDASATHVAAGLRVRPAAGLWLAAAAGPTRTGGQTRALADAQLGWDFFFQQRRFGVGPVIGWAHVFQPDSELRPADANVVFAGVHAVWDPEKGPKPDGDRDGDGIKDSVDRCPDDPEDKDGYEDEDGCPERDNDGDGIPDALDRCPLVPEDADGFEDADGCPDPDNDRDGILDPKDACPNEPETKNGYADEDGCPDSEQVRVTGDKIVLDDRVHFWTNSARIRPASYPLLERVAKLVLSQPTYVHIEVQGHTDERGPAWFNQKLSDDRAQSVLELLVKHGLERSRLSSRGFGATVPLVEKKSEHAWFMNRRVEFAITRETRSVERAGGKP